MDTPEHRFRQAADREDLETIIRRGQDRLRRHIPSETRAERLRGWIAADAYGWPTAIALALVIGLLVAVLAAAEVDRGACLVTATRLQPGGNDTPVPIQRCAAWEWPEGRP